MRTSIFFTFTLLRFLRNSFESSLCIDKFNSELNKVENCCTFQKIMVHESPIWKSENGDYSQSFSKKQKQEQKEHWKHRESPLPAVYRGEDTWRKEEGIEEETYVFWSNPNSNGREWPLWLPKVLKRLPGSPCWLKSSSALSWTSLQSSFKWTITLYVSKRQIWRCLQTWKSKTA